MIKHHPVLDDLYTADSPYDFIGTQVLKIEQDDKPFPIVRLKILKTGRVIRVQCFKAIIPYRTFRVTYLSGGSGGLDTPSKTP